MVLFIILTRKQETWEKWFERAERASQFFVLLRRKKCFTYRPETREKAIINDCEQANFLCVSETCDSSQYFVGESHSLSVQCVLMFVTLVIILWSCSWRFIPTRNFPETREKPINGCERAERASRNFCTFASETYIYIYVFLYRPENQKLMKKLYWLRASQNSETYDSPQYSVDKSHGLSVQ